MLYLVALSALVCLSMLAMILMFNQKMKFSREKSSSFECGFSPLKIFRAMFSLRFFMIMLMFLIFDIEIVVLLPLPLNFYMVKETWWTTLTVFFMLLLLGGLLLEWTSGSIIWS